MYTSRDVVHRRIRASRSGTLGETNRTRTRRNRAQEEISNQIKNKESPEPKRNEAREKANSPGILFGNFVFFVGALV